MIILYLKHEGVIISKSQALVTQDREEFRCIQNKILRVYNYGLIPQINELVEKIMSI